jgi:CheY-like chemotaxis protein
MNRENQREIGPGQLADLLAELLEQFRHFCGFLETVPGMASHMARIKVAARLLSALAETSGSGGKGFSRLGGVLGEWVECFESSPESFPLHLYSPLERLADFLEEILAKRDRGFGAGELAADAGWQATVASFRHAGTPLAVLEDVDDQLRRWGYRWNADNLTPVQEQQLYHRWLSLRNRGDVLFPAGTGQGGPAESPGQASGSPLVVLLVDSTFRRDQITEKMTDYEYRVEIPCDPEQALEFLAAGNVPRAVLCDNLEPTRHLARVREGLLEGPFPEKVPLVLIVGGSSNDTADLQRAKSLGALGAWREPYDPADLHRILQRLSQP